MLLGAGANPSARNRHGETPLELAADRFRLNSDPSASFLEPIRLLLDAGADVNASSDDGSTALHKLFADGMEDNVSLMMAAMLLWRGARADVEDISGVTPAGAWAFGGGWRGAIRRYVWEVEGEYEEEYEDEADVAVAVPELSSLGVDSSEGDEEEVAGSELSSHGMGFWGEGESDLDDLPGPGGNAVMVVDFAPLIADYYSLMVARSTVGRPKGARANAGGRAGV